MSDIEKELKEAGADNDFQVIREQIKARPINKAKLARNTLLAAISAVVFGLVAVVTFLFLSPIIADYFEKKEEEPVKNIIVFSEETEEEEMNPEDMLITQPPPEPEIDYSQFQILEQNEIQDIVDSIEFDITDYQNLYQSMTALANETQKSLVRVTAVIREKDWFDTLYETASEISGVIVAENEGNYFILTYSSAASKAQSIYVTFCNGVSSEASINATDSDTGLCVLKVDAADVNEITKEAIAVAKLGVSSSKMAGSLALAIGSPMGTFDSLNYGMITASGTSLSVPDYSYKKMTTDIYGSSNATGVLINFKGEVIGIIDTKFSSTDTKNLISAIAISDLKKTIEAMINQTVRHSIGIYGCDVPDEATIQYGAPAGALVLSTKLDSPAMLAGIQSGDIVVAVGEREITKYQEYVSALRTIDTETVQITVSRQTSEGYKPITYTVTPHVVK